MKHCESVADMPSRCHAANLVLTTKSVTFDDLVNSYNMTVFAEWHHEHLGRLAAYSNMPVDIFKVNFVHHIAKQILRI